MTIEQADELLKGLGFTFDERGYLEGVPNKYDCYELIEVVWNKAIDKAIEDSNYSSYLNEFKIFLE